MGDHQAKFHESKFFKNEVLSEIFMPVSLNSIWLLIICCPYEKLTRTLVFDMCYPEVIRVLEKLAEKLKTLAIDERLTLWGNYMTRE